LTVLGNEDSPMGIIVKSKRHAAWAMAVFAQGAHSVVRGRHWIVHLSLSLRGNALGAFAVPRTTTRLFARWYAPCR
jgi:hypothetical protein